MGRVEIPTGLNRTRILSWAGIVSASGWAPTPAFPGPTEQGRSGDGDGGEAPELLPEIGGDRDGRATAELFVDGRGAVEVLPEMDIDGDGRGAAELLAEMVVRLDCMR
ncbi:hypothetical protein E2562_026187 [Oryza meyeriana var. granulata]|uniref:Uncharacterized protein n=1 Tax=Oryza meyeriana var. granulata TaxID=110450 RepID=A0A6G1E322_9ORYZ|nr:hypothetical protein E2562_026187 [Oryza meyeriana var. granulata]